MSPTATGVISKPRVLSSAARDLERGAHELTIRLARNMFHVEHFSIVRPIIIIFGHPAGRVILRMLPASRELA
jgi:hypothetical protein